VAHDEAALVAEDDLSRLEGDEAREGVLVDGRIVVPGCLGIARVHFDRVADVNALAI
jgi:hypothetical protein